MKYPLLKQNLSEPNVSGSNQWVNDHQKLMLHLDTTNSLEILDLVVDLCIDL